VKLSLALDPSIEIVYNKNIAPVTEPDTLKQKVDDWGRG
jgi:hypothetical protein